MFLTSTHASMVIVFFIVVFMASIGCAPEPIHIEHRLPAPVALPSDIGQITAGTFTVKESPVAASAEILQTALNERLRNIPQLHGESLAPAAPSAPQDTSLSMKSTATVGGVLTATVKDTRQVHTFRRWDPATRSAQVLETPSVVRTAEVRVLFEITTPSSPEPISQIEIQKSYTSLADPSLRGPLGLDRPDDPARLPDETTIITSLLNQAAHSFVSMISPITYHVDLKLRSSLSPGASTGFEAAKAGDYQASAERLKKALSVSPEDSNLHFNLAVVSEALGDFPTALAHYLETDRLLKGTDSEAVEGARRTLQIHHWLGLPLPE